jgi:hypothetical protein
MVINSCATPDGKIFCELSSGYYCGTPVFTVHVLETTDYQDYKEIHRSYPTGNKRKASTIYKQFCNKYLRSKINK